jgi:hypothetical protein
LTKIQKLIKYYRKELSWKLSSIGLRSNSGLRLRKQGKLRSRGLKICSKMMVLRIREKVRKISKKIELMSLKLRSLKTRLST